MFASSSQNFSLSDVIQILIREIIFKKSSERHSTATMLFTVALEVPATILLIQKALGIRWLKCFSFAIQMAYLAVGALEPIRMIPGAEVEQFVAKAMDHIFFNPHTDISLSTLLFYTGSSGLSNLKS